MDCLASTIACCAIWEIWKARNSKRHETRPRDIWKECVRWAMKLSRLITASYHPSFQHDATLRALHVRPMPHADKPAWKAWFTSETGVIINVSIMVKEDRTLLNGLARHGSGNFLVTVNESYQHERPLVYVEDILDRIMCLLPMNTNVAQVQSSHACFWYLMDKEEDTPGDVLYVRRRLAQKLTGASFFRIHPTQNIASNVILCTMPLGTYMVLDSLNVACKRAIHADLLHLPSADHQGHPPHRNQDDLDIRTTRYNVSFPNDDSRI